jgi:hypothetical protein
MRLNFRLFLDLDCLHQGLNNTSNCKRIISASVTLHFNHFTAFFKALLISSVKIVNTRIGPFTLYGLSAIVSVLENFKFNLAIAMRAVNIA